MIKRVKLMRENKKKINILADMIKSVYISKYAEDGDRIKCTITDPIFKYAPNFESFQINFTIINLKQELLTEIDCCDLLKMHTSYQNYRDSNGVLANSTVFIHSNMDQLNPVIDEVGHFADSSMSINKFKL